jgi:phage gpG-like protein
MASASVTPEGESRFLSSIRTLSQSVETVEPLLELISEIVRASVDRNFDVGGRHGDANEFGGAPAGTEGTWRESLRAKLDGGTTLNDTGALASSIVYNVSTDTFSFGLGTNLVYAAIHQFGGDIEPKDPNGYLAFRTADGRFRRVKKVSIVARPYLVLQDEDIDEILQTVVDWYTALLS